MTHVLTRFWSLPTFTLTPLTIPVRNSESAVNIDGNWGSRMLFSVTRMQNVGRPERRQR